MMMGKISGRGSPIKRGIASGVMTTVGGLGHALPYLIPFFWTATAIAVVVVFFELWAIAWIQNKYMETPFLRAAFQVVLAGRWCWQRYSYRQWLNGDPSILISGLAHCAWFKKRRVRAFFIGGFRRSLSVERYIAKD